MGGGGLRILKHKKWHVWTRENIEKVRRDERLHEEATRRDFREKRKRDLDSRVEALKRPKQGTTSALPHVNFFEVEPPSATPVEPKSQPKIHPDEGIALGGSLNPAYRPRHRRDKPESNEPWYVRQNEPSSEGEAPRDSFADPMATIVGRPKTFLPSPENDDGALGLDFAGDTVVTTRTELKKAKKAKKKAKCQSSSDRMEQLRRERTEREAAEQRRLQSLLRR
ncbi:hypothetical protein ACHHYP_00296 [Achlya hypogyna]|uniref:CBF1-interacting co-repressor CIR N-terminal domain-containing protein n=1 Tax=Achlya hypogyna TaxID=1202772 RepID=A0A1V9ZUP7_ACHHY|nr:hypothetical protein ACHHYP_00296 [Achlya hypogyna]